LVYGRDRWKGGNTRRCFARWRSLATRAIWRRRVGDGDGEEEGADAGDMLRMTKSLEQSGYCNYLLYYTISAFDSRCF
jgi:hypothetical protein